MRGGLRTLNSGVTGEPVTANPQPPRHAGQLRRLAAAYPRTHTSCTTRHVLVRTVGLFILSHY